MSDHRFLQKGFDKQLSHLVEEAGELLKEFGDMLAAAGKTQRWGRDSVNPLLPPEERETNEAWLMRTLPGVKRELTDVMDAISRLEATVRGERS